MEIKINNLIWEIKIVPASNPELVTDSYARGGTTWIMQQKIYLSSDLTKNTARLVIAHELTHAFLYSTQMQAEEEMTYTEEEMCEFVSKWGEQIFELTDEVYDELYGTLKY